MYIYNTTFHVMNEVKDEFINWLKTEYVPKAISKRLLSNPQLALIMAKDKSDTGVNLALQFYVESIDDLDEWYKSPGRELVEAMTTKFSNKVGGFSTIMKLMEVE